jgi:hypothetical protein
VSSMAVSSEARICMASDVLYRQVDGESVVLDLKTERYLGLDEVATRMWQLITGSESVQAACEALLQEYDVEPERLRRDLSGFIQELLELGLVEVASSNEQPLS